MVSGIAQWQASVLAINHGLPHCSPVNHRTRGTRELPSVKWNEFISVIPHYVFLSASLFIPFLSLAHHTLSLFLLISPSSSPFSAPHLPPSLNSPPTKLLPAHPRVFYPPHATGKGVWPYNILYLDPPTYPLSQSFQKDRQESFTQANISQFT